MQRQQEEMAQTRGIPAPARRNEAQTKEYERQQQVQHQQYQMYNVHPDRPLNQWMASLGRLISKIDIGILNLVQQQSQQQHRSQQWGEHPLMWDPMRRGQ